MLTAIERKGIDLGDKTPGEEEKIVDIEDIMVGMSERF